jgi:hypothetical protein
MQKVREFFHNFDMFTAMPTLRAKSEPEVANSFGGILSIIVLLLFSYLFIAQLAQVTNWEKISSI